MAGKAERYEHNQAETLLPWKGNAPGSILQRDHSAQRYLRAAYPSQMLRARSRPYCADEAKQERG